ncbi:TetR/AcrR family transcriptional regulator [Furfurilactobacillus entadae]|uniref:TetR/AcrR family transcriptional regulator n=1 Tax=Furfurilactobacillus entadae TaxID=2922307 RepID=UPI0035E52BC9
MTEKKRAPRKTNRELTETIFKTTTAILENEGYENVTFNNVARQSGVGRPVLYRRWQTPFELLLDAEDYFDDQDVDSFEDIDFSGHSLRENIINSLAHFDSTRPFMRAVLIELGKDNPVVNQYFNDLHQQQLTIMNGMLHQAIADGEISTPVTETVKLLPFNMLLYQAMVNQDGLSLTYITELVDTVVLPAIMAQQE